MFRRQFFVPPRRLLNFSFELSIGSIITSLHLFYMELAIVCAQNYRCDEYPLVNDFNDFVQSAVNARCQRDENPNSSVVAETMKLHANSSYGYQVLDRSHYSVTR